jgi:hypothetical protein
MQVHEFVSPCAQSFPERYSTNQFAHPLRLFSLADVWETGYCLVQAKRLSDDHGGVGRDQRWPVGVHDAAYRPLVNDRAILVLLVVPVDLLRAAGELSV